MTALGAILDDDQITAFGDQGYLVLPGFYDLETEVEPVRRDIYEIVGLVAAQHGVTLSRGPYDPETFDAGYLTLKAVDRRLASIVYDAVKQLASFMRLVASPRNDAVFRQLRGTGLVGIAGGGSGIRIDNPDESKYLAWWHQEYPAQFRSPDGVVFWSPLRPLTPELGPVEVLAGSHVEGLLPVQREDDGSGRQDAYALRLHRESELVSRYDAIAPLTRPGDVVLLDFLTIHRSGVNLADVPRWTMQLRYFGFNHPVGRSIEWAGSFAAGKSIADVHPELEVEA